MRDPAVGGGGRGRVRVKGAGGGRGRAGGADRSRFLRLRLRRARSSGGERGRSPPPPPAPPSSPATLRPPPWCRNPATEAFTRGPPRRRSSRWASWGWTREPRTPAGTERCSSPAPRAASGAASSANPAPGSRAAGSPPKGMLFTASCRISSTMCWRDRGAGLSFTTHTCEYMDGGQTRRERPPAPHPLRIYPPAAPPPQLPERMPRGGMLQLQRGCGEGMLGAGAGCGAPERAAGGGRG